MVVAMYAVCVFIRKNIMRILEQVGENNKIDT